VSEQHIADTPTPTNTGPAGGWKTPVRVDDGYKWLGVRWRGHNPEFELALGVLIAVILVFPILGATIAMLVLGGLTFDWRTAGVLLVLLPILVVLGGILIIDGVFGLKLGSRPAARRRSGR
jgi:hypothetical protein